MAVARHSENIEVQDEEQDDTNYENETTITARRTNVEMSEEGHYERLDLQKKDDAVYEDLRAKTRKDKRLPKKIRQSGRRPFRVAVCLGMLCLVLLGVNIAQLALHYRSPCSNSMTNDNLTLENTQLKSDNSNLKQDNNQLQSEVKQLKTKIAEIDKPCPTGWRKFAYSCYHTTTGLETWQKGRDYCQNKGADLVVKRYWRKGSPENKEDANCAAYWHGNDGTDPGTWNTLCSYKMVSICER